MKRFLLFGLLLLSSVVIFSSCTKKYITEGSSNTPISSVYFNVQPSQWTDEGQGNYSYSVNINNLSLPSNFILNADAVLIFASNNSTSSYAIMGQGTYFGDYSYAYETTDGTVTIIATDNSTAGTYAAPTTTMYFNALFLQPDVDLNQSNVNLKDYNSVHQNLNLKNISLK